MSKLPIQNYLLFLLDCKFNFCCRIWLVWSKLSETLSFTIFHCLDLNQRPIDHSLHSGNLSSVLISPCMTSQWNMVILAHYDTLFIAPDFVIPVTQLVYFGLLTSCRSQVRIEQAGTFVFLNNDIFLKIDIIFLKNLNFFQD